MFKSFKTVFPALKPFLRLVGVDTSSIEDALERVDELAEQIDEMGMIPDRFNDLFGPRGWIIYELMNLEVAKDAIEKAEAGDLEGAEDVLLDYFNVDTVKWQLRTMYAVEAFRPRMDLAEKALLDYEKGRYHACTPVVLAQIDGLVSELHDEQRGFFSDAADLEAWDSLAAHSKGLNQLSAIFRKGRRKTTTEPIDIPYRHGIMHGRDLGYDNKIVACKTWQLCLPLENGPSKQNAACSRHHRRNRRKVGGKSALTLPITLGKRSAGRTGILENFKSKKFPLMPMGVIWRKEHQKAYWQSIFIGGKRQTMAICRITYPISSISTKKSPFLQRLENSIIASDLSPTNSCLSITQLLAWRISECNCR